MRNLAIVFLAVCSPAFATMAHLKEFKAAYPAFKTVSCKVCHTTQPQMNPYGLDLQKAKGDLKAIEGLDSDGDTFKNLDEINAQTAPGDKDQHPIAFWF